MFKGGTSLSNVFSVIDRFSEDIDLSLSPDFLNLPEAGTSRNQANKWMTRAEAACGVAVRNQIAPALEAAVAGILDQRDRAWFEFPVPPEWLAQPEVRLRVEVENRSGVVTEIDRRRVRPTP